MRKLNSGHNGEKLQVSFCCVLLGGHKWGGDEDIVKVYETSALSIGNASEEETCRQVTDAK